MRDHTVVEEHTAGVGRPLGDTWIRAKMKGGEQEIVAWIKGWVH